MHGLALDAKQLWKLKIAVPLLALLPCLVEGAVRRWTRVHIPLGVAMAMGVNAGVRMD